jgi:putative transcriptional regulator
MQNDVRKLRENRALSQGDLARDLGVSRQTVNAIETGRYLPSLPLALAIGRYFGKSIEEIFREDDQRLGAN